MAVFHTGEIEVQERAGVQTMAQKVGRIIREEMPPAAAIFLEQTQLAAFGFADQNGEMWASIAATDAGFLGALDEKTAILSATWLQNLPESEPLRQRWETRQPFALGMCALDASTRRRMRLNGIARNGAKGLEIETQEVYSNCAKYIQQRLIVGHQKRAMNVESGERLTPELEKWVKEADTLFFATAVITGADCSHRGGRPGWIGVQNGVLHWSDYAGNAMFNTLGNLQQNSRAALVFLDWNSGATLQLSGQARTIWRGNEREIQFETHRWRLTRGASSLQWQLKEISPFCP